MPKNWDEIHMQGAMRLSSLSNYSRTHHGAVVVPDDGKHIEIGGYNGLPRGTAEQDAVIINRNIEVYGDDERPWHIHAEANAIIHAGHKCQGATLYITGHPCLECAKLALQAGIKKIFFGPVVSRMVDSVEVSYVELLCRAYGMEIEELCV